MSEENVIKHGIEGKFDFLDHPADVYIVAYGKDLIELFENAGLALFETMTDTRRVEAKEERVIETNGIDLENLLYRWIEDLLTLYYSENLMCSKIVVDSIEVKRVEDGVEYSIKGRCYGEPFDPEKHEPDTEVKAVSYHMMKIGEIDGKKFARVLVDI